MKASELKDLSAEQLNEKLVECLREQFNLRMQASTGQLTQTHLLREARRNVAMVKTVLRQKADA